MGGNRKESRRTLDVGIRPISVDVVSRLNDIERKKKKRGEEKREGREKEERRLEPDTNRSPLWNRFQSPFARRVGLSAL